MEIAMTVDATDRTIDEEIVQARQALMQLARDEPTRSWTAYELAVCARNGWSSAVVDLALRELLDEGVFEQGPDLRVRLVRPPT
jgi:hypothetical protein